MEQDQEEYLGMPLNTYCMLIHLSSIIIPIFGVVIPIVMWLSQKENSEFIDEHGKIHINWMLSLFMYAMVLLLFPISVLTIYIFALLLVLHFIFTITAGIKANKGKFWVYPMSVRFIK